MFINLYSFNEPAHTEFYPLSLHDALPIWRTPRPWHAASRSAGPWPPSGPGRTASSSAGSRWDRRRWWTDRSEEHTSELQSRGHLVCRLLLEKKKKTRY